MTEEIRVLLIADKFELRGSSHSTIRLCSGLKQRDIDFEIITPDARLLPEQPGDDWNISEYKHLNTPVWGALVRKLIKQDVIHHPPQLIHVQSPTFARFGLELGRLLNVPSLLSIQHPPRPQAKWLKLVNQFEHLIVVSRNIKEQVIALTDYPVEKIEEIHNGVLIPDMQTGDEILAEKCYPVVGMAGPLESVKGIPFFLGAAQKVLKKNPEVEFLIAGAGPEETNLRRLAKELKIQHQVTFAPNVADFSIPLQAMDLFCLPSLEQGLGTIMLEAMAMGRPVIASSVGGLDSIIRDNKNGWIVPPAETGPLASKIQYALAHPEEARELGLRGQEMVRKKFSVDEMVNYTVKLYHQVLHSEKECSASQT